MKYTLSALLVLALALYSCSNDEEERMIKGSMFKCHFETEWDSTSTSNALIGQWEWAFRNCYWTFDEFDKDISKGMKVEFRSDGTYEITKDGQLIQTSTWALINAIDEQFALRQEDWVWELDGRIFLCDGQLQFNDSYQDGCDNYYFRVE